MSDGVMSSFLSIPNQNLIQNSHLNTEKSNRKRESGCLSSVNSFVVFDVFFFVFFFLQ